MKLNKQTAAGIATIALLMSVPAAFAGNITVADNNFGSDVYGTHYIETTSGWYKGATGTPGAAATWEYQEVEPGMQTGSVWDLAAFVTPTAGRLGVVSAYNLAAGYGDTTIGDIFVSTNPGSLNGYADPNSSYPTYILNSQFNFNFAIRMNFALGTYSVISLNSTTVIQNGEYSGGNGYYNAASQPWKVATTLAGTGYTSTGNLGTVIASGAMTYTDTQSAAVSSALSGYSMTSDYKYYAEVGTSWLAPYLNSTNPVALYKLTMECGNDNMIGIQSAGFNSVPDGSATLCLLGMGVLAMAGAASYRTRRIRR